MGVPDTLLPLLDYAGVGDGGWLQACKNREFWRPEWCKTRLDHVNYHFRQDTEHRYAYDFETMENVLKEAGFIESSSANLILFSIQKVASLERLYVNARKPSAVLKI